MLFHQLEDENHKQHDLHHQTGNLEWLAVYKSMLDICDMYLKSILPVQAHSASQCCWQSASRPTYKKTKPNWQAQVGQLKETQTIPHQQPSNASDCRAIVKNKELLTTSHTLEW